MTDFEKVQIGFDIGFVILACIGLAALSGIEYWTERTFKARFGYITCWGVA